MSESTETKTVGLEEVGAAVEAAVSKALAEKASPEQMKEALKSVLAEENKARRAERLDPITPAEASAMSAKFYKGLRDHARGKAVVDSDTVFKIDSDSGAIVTPPIVSSRIIENMVQASVAASRVTTFPQSSPSIIHPVDATDDTVDYPTETDIKPSAEIGLSMRTWTLKLGSKLIAVSNQILDQAVINVGDYINGLFARGFGRALDVAVFRGVAGVYTSVCDAASNKIYCGGDITSALAYAIMNQASALSSVYTPGAAWFLHPQMLALVRLISDDVHRPILADPTAALTPNILGYPYVLTDAMPTPAEAVAGGLCGILFGNLANVWVGQNYNLRISVSKEAAFTANVGGQATLVSAFERNLTLFLAEMSRSVATARPEAFSAIFSGSAS